MVWPAWGEAMSLAFKSIGNAAMIGASGNSIVLESDVRAGETCSAGTALGVWGGVAIGGVEGAGGAT